MADIGAGSIKFLCFCSLFPLIGAGAPAAPRPEAAVAANAAQAAQGAPRAAEETQRLRPSLTISAAQAAPAAAANGALFGSAPFPASPSAARRQEVFSYAPEGAFIRISFGQSARLAPRQGQKSASGKQGNTEFYGLIELDLKQGRKTYWRNPGLSGFAPKIALDGGASAHILFPAPQLLQEGDEWNYIYKNHVALPFRISLPKQKQAVYTGSLSLGICEKICMPQKIPFRFSPPATLRGKHGNAALEAALAALPKAADKNFGIISAGITKNGLEARLAYPRGAGGAPQLYADGGSVQFGLPEPQPARTMRHKRRGGGKTAVQIYSLPLLFGKPASGAILHYTATLPNGAAVSGAVTLH